MIKYTPTLTKDEYLNLSFFQKLTKENMISDIKKELKKIKKDSLEDDISKEYLEKTVEKLELLEELEKETYEFYKPIIKKCDEISKEIEEIKKLKPNSTAAKKNREAKLNTFEKELLSALRDFKAKQCDYNYIYYNHHYQAAEIDFNQQISGIIAFVKHFFDNKDSVIENKTIFFGSNKDNNCIANTYDKVCNIVEKKVIKQYFIGKYTDLRGDKPFKKLMDDVVNIKVCLYCNINYTYAVDDGVSKRLLYQLDHFHSKDTFPWLALSFWNLIPSCSTCNASYKLTRALKIHPYANEISAPFSYKPNGVPDKEENINVVFEGSSPDEREDITTLGLVERYNKHKNIVVELYEKRQKYTDTQIKELLDFDKEKKLFENETEIKQLVFGYVPKNEFHNNSLSKFRFDIAKEMNLI